MKARVLIVEDEMLVACHLEGVLEDLGYDPIGIASDTAGAIRLAEDRPDIALVDLNLRDGATGPKIGAELAQRGVTVVFVTANPRELAAGVPGALGVLSKPCNDQCVSKVVDYALGVSRGEAALLSPPAALTLFSTATH